MKPSFTPVIIPSQKKADGSYNVKIRVTFKRKSKRFSTNIDATPQDLTRTLKFKDNEVKRKAFKLADDMRELCSEIDYLDLQGMDVEDIIKFIDSKAETKKTFKLDFVEFMKEKAKTKGASEVHYLSAANSLVRYLKGRTLYVNDITVRFLRGFEEYIKNEPRVVPSFMQGRTPKVQKAKGDCRAISQYLSRIRHMYSLARLEYNDPDLNIYRIPNNPFEYYKIPKQPASKRRNKSQEFIQMVIDETSRTKGVERLALEVFVLSFALEGMNLADLYSCAPSKGRWLEYNRRKTAGRRADGAKHKVYIPDEVMPLVDRFRDYDGEHMFIFHRRYKDFKIFTNKANRALKHWSLRRDVEHFTMYAARHSFASLARKAGVEKATIDEMLCHVGNLRMADVYTEPSFELHKEANEKILALFDWSAIQ